MKLAQLTPDTRNANKGTPRGRKMVAESLRRYGAGRSILVDRAGNIIAGNKTVEGAKAIGLDDVQIVKTDGTRLIAVQRTDLDINDRKARELAIADNRAAEVGLEWDPDVLKGLELEDVDMAPFFNERELVQFFARIDGDAPEPQLDRAAELQRKWDTKPGQLWLIGDHRLLCGDSTKPEEIARLWGTQSARASLFATDPPYAVGYKGGNHPASKSNSEETRDRDWSDKYREASSEGLGREFYAAFVAVAKPFLEPNAAWYCWHASRRQAMLEAVWEEAGAFVHQQIIWVKSRPVLTYSAYMWQHEPCFMGWLRGNKPKMLNPHPREFPSSVWEVPTSEVESKDHPTSKPLRLFSAPMQMHTTPGSICYEPFSGSGTQLCAAENMKRMCYAVELEPKFVAVTLQRLFDMGLQPVLADA